MLYRSLNKISKNVNFENAVKNGLPNDGGLYFPLEVTHLGNKFFETITEKTNHEIALDVITQFVGNSIDKKNLTKIIKKTLTFDFPLIKIDDKIRVLEHVLSVCYLFYIKFT